jgi:hypothetical protein
MVPVKSETKLHKNWVKVSKEAPGGLPKIHTYPDIHILYFSQNLQMN